MINCKKCGLDKDLIHFNRKELNSGKFSYYKTCKVCNGEKDRVVCKTLYGEVWKPIINFEGLYEISNFGRVKSLGNNKYKVDKIIKHCISKNGYAYCTLWINCKQKKYKIHRLIAIHFIPNPENKPFINHIDSNRMNNSIENLEWCTQKENIHHAINNGRMDFNGEKNPSAKLNKSDVYNIKKLHNNLVSIKDLSTKYSVSDVSIRNIINDKTWSK